MLLFFYHEITKINSAKSVAKRSVFVFL